jgi:hypothetical protein
VILAGECRHHRAPTAARGPRSVDKQQRRRLPRAVVDHVHPMQVFDVAHIHARDDARATAYQSWTNVSAKTGPLPPCPANLTRVTPSARPRDRAEYMAARPSRSLADSISDACDRRAATRPRPRQPPSTSRSRSKGLNPAVAPRRMPQVRWQCLNISGTGQRARYPTRHLPPLHVASIALSLSK